MGVDRGGSVTCDNDKTEGGKKSGMEGMEEREGRIWRWDKMQKL